jgi:hypothetical protein
VTVRERLLSLRAELDALLADLPSNGEVTAVSSAASTRFMKLPAFAKARDLSPRTIRDYCDMGMPHQGEGRGRRILVAEADMWIDSGGPRKARMSRKGQAA